MTHPSVDSPVPSSKSESVQVEPTQLDASDSGSADQTAPVAQTDSANQTSEPPFISEEVPQPTTVDFADFWYVVAQTEQLKPNQVLSRMVLGEWLAIFRGSDGLPVALRDRCMHRNSRLSGGTVKQGQLHCPYHGWIYDKRGRVVAVPAEGDQFKPLKSRCAQWYSVREQDGYIYVRLQTPLEEFQPFRMPHYQDAHPKKGLKEREPGWQTVRVINRFENSVTNCVENFIDIPHTVSVHPGIFRQQRQQKLDMTVTRSNGCVTAEYRNETTNLGWFSRFLNTKAQEIRHIDSFHMPNVTSVEYDFGPHRRLFITSQSVPETETSTLVYTDVTFNYGIWSRWAKPFVRWTAQRIIKQDIKALKIQQETIAKYDQRFSNTPADTIHVFVESIRTAISQGKDPRQLPDRSVDVTFWV
ncbi:MAG: aromatic ring-hydroxylating dioxygenase subunit alpha [Thainema sp.]